MRSLTARGPFHSYILLGSHFCTRRFLFYFVGVGVGVGVYDGGGLFLSVNLLIIIWYIVYVSIYIYAKGIVAEQKYYGF